MAKSGVIQAIPDDEQRFVAKSPKILVWYCPVCGCFVAASPHPKIIAVAAARHQCPAFVPHEFSRSENS